MSDKEESPEEEDAPEERKKKSSTIKSVLFSAIIAMTMGVAAAAGVYFFAPDSKACVADTAVASEGHNNARDKRNVTFVNLEPLVVTLGPNAKSSYLKISVSLETSHSYEKELDELSPRFRDALNTYLRAVDENDLIVPAAMARLRAQMLRRLQLVASEQAVTNVLITEFVLT
ncbi:MAG: flagellar basal body-associated protein FliL [Parvularculaceae bacterium]